MKIDLTSAGELAPKRQDVIRLSPLQPVSMEESYFDMVHPDHFWVARRFDVTVKLTSDLIRPGSHCAEIGCGSGVLQRQLEGRFGVEVDGIDLSLKALEQNVAASGKLYYYDVLEQLPEFKARYDFVFLFDVLEHITDDLRFLNACLHHVKNGGHVVVNVPARKELFSKYDRLAGHVRRYTFRELKNLADSAGLSMSRWTYWGVPLYPILTVRKILLSFIDDSSAYQRGFTPPNRLANAMLRTISRAEPIPQRLIGTSIIAVFQKPAV